MSTEPLNSAVKKQKNSKIRCDELLMAKRICRTLEEARALVMTGNVIADDQRVDLPSQLLSLNAELRVKRKNFVSRGGEKLAGAFEDFGLIASLTDRVVLDIGCSTGGFTDCCLQLGVRKVVAIDVGTNVLAWKLRQDLRVEVHENCDIRRLDTKLLPRFDVVVADISFNSLQNLMDAILSFASPDGTDFVLLIKPQFELPRKSIPRGGVVLDEVARQQAVVSVSQALSERGINNFRHVDSRLSGRRGNVEIFIYFRAAN